MNPTIIQAQIDTLLALPPCKTASDTRLHGERVSALRDQLAATQDTPTEPMDDDTTAREQWDAETWQAMVTTATMAAAILQSRPVELRAASPRVRQGDTPSEIEAADERARWGWVKGVHETS